MFDTNDNSTSVLQLFEEGNTKAMHMNVLEIVLKSVGIVFNSLCILVWARPEMQHNPGFIYWITLSAYDLVKMIVSLLMNVCISVEDLHTVRYFVMGIVLYAGKVCSTYTTVALSVDRAFALSMPLKWKRISTKFSNRVGALSIFALGVVDRIPLLLAQTFPAARIFHDEVKLPIIDPLVSTLLPLIAILIMNSIVVSKVNKRRHDIRLSRRITTNQTIAVYKITAQLVFISFFSIVSHGMYILLMITFLPFMQAKSVITPGMDKVFLVMSLYRIAAVVNTSVNFIAYSIFCRSFKRKLKYLLCVWKKPTRGHLFA